MDPNVDLEYVLELPADHASAFRKRLLRTGVPAQAIRVVEPWLTAPTPQTPPTQPRPSTPPGSPSPNVDNRTALARRTDRVPQPNDCSRSCKDHQPSHAKLHVRFLPDSIRLGTYAEGLYNVTIRRRLSPEGRETVCISMSSRAAAATVRDEHMEFANQWRSAGGGGYSCDGGPVTLPPCRCDSTECKNNRKRLCEYFANNDTDTSVCDNRGSLECVYKRFADAIQITSATNISGVYSNANTLPAISNVKFVLPGSDVAISTGSAEPLPRPLSRNLDLCCSAQTIRSCSDIVRSDSVTEAGQVIRRQKKKSLANRVWHMLKNVTPFELPCPGHLEAIDSAQARMLSARTITRDQAIKKLVPLKIATLRPLDRTAEI